MPMALGLGLGLPYLGAACGPYPALDLNFIAMAASGVLDPRITFARGTLATLTNAAGNVAYAPHNLLLQSDNFILSWAAVGSTATANRIQEDTSNGQHRVQQGITGVPAGPVSTRARLRADQRSKVSIEISAGAGGCSAVFDLSAGVISTAASSYGSGVTNASATIVSVGGGEYDCTVSANGPGGTTFVYIATSNGSATSYIGDGASGAFLSRAQLNVGPLQPYYPTTSSAYHGPRFTYDATTHAALGLLIEGQRSNRLLWSEDFTNAAWVKTSATVTANTAVAPDGNTTADTLTATGANATIVQSITPGVGSQTQSIYLMRKTGTGNIDVNADGATWVTQTLSSVAWTRCVVTQTCGAGALSAGVRIVTSGDEVYAWGAQHE